MNLRLLLSTALTSTIFAGMSVHSAEINWGNRTQDILYDSNGNALTSDFVFEIGAFLPGFTPTAANVTDWAANWTIFDAGNLNTADLFGDGPVNFFSGSAVHQTNAQSSSISATPGATFLQNTQAYLWAYNSKDVSITSEWALVTDLILAPDTGDLWRFPSPSNDTGFLTWSLRAADTAIYGKLENGSISGGGDFTVTPATFSLQTHQVPEPGGALLIASAGLLFILRRSRFLSQTK
jgi:hypothetical protein